jgi:hypothetical protein
MKDEALSWTRFLGGEGGDWWERRQKKVIRFGFANLQWCSECDCCCVVAETQLYPKRVKTLGRKGKRPDQERSERLANLHHGD